MKVCTSKTKLAPMKVVLTLFFALLFQIGAQSQVLKWNSNALPYSLVFVDDTVSDVYEVSAEFKCTNFGGDPVKFTKDAYEWSFSTYDFSESIGSDDSGYFKVSVKVGNRQGMLDYEGADVRLKSTEPYVYSFQVRTLVATAKTERIYENGKLRGVIGYNKNMVKVMAEVDENGVLSGFGPIDERHEKQGAWAFFRNGAVVGSKIYSQAARVSLMLVDMDNVLPGPPVDLESNLRSLHYYQERIETIDSAFSYLNGIKSKAAMANAGIAGRIDFFISYQEDSVVVYSSGMKSRFYPNRGNYLFQESTLYFSKNKKEKSLPQGQFDVFYRLIENEYAILYDYSQPEWKTIDGTAKMEAMLSKKYAFLGLYVMNGVNVVSLSGLSAEKRKEALNTLKADRQVLSICQGITTQNSAELEYLRNEVMFVHRGVYDYEKIKAVAAKYGFELLNSRGALQNESGYLNTSKMTSEDFIARYIKMSKDPAFQGARMETMSTRNMLD